MWCGVPFADEKEDRSVTAKRLFDRGVSLFDDEKYTDAADAFRKAYETRPSWKILFNIGQAEAAAGRLGLSLEAFQQYMVEGGDEIPDDRKDYVIREIKRLKELVGELKIEAPDGSILYVDDVKRDTTPLKRPVLVVAGEDHEAMVELPDGRKEKHTFSVWGGKTVKLVFDEKEPETEITPDALEPEHERDMESEGLDPLYFWIGLGGTVAFGGAFGAMIFVVDAKFDEIYDDPDDDALRDDARVLQATGITFLALAGAAAVTTGILAIFTDFDTEAEASSSDLSIAPFASDQTAGVGLMGRF